MKRWHIGLALGGIALFVSIFIEPVRTLLFGWIGFLARVLPRASPDLPTVWVSVAAAVLFTAGLHWAGRAWGPHWKWRYSVALSALVYVLFAAGVAIVGLFHMGAWLATSKTPVRVPGFISGAVASARTRNDMKMIALNMHNYESAFGWLPQGGTFDSSGRALHGWELDSLYGIVMANQIDRKLPWDHPQNERYFRCVVNFFINPSLPDAPQADERGFGFNHFSANAHVFPGEQRTSLAKMTDGTSNTLLIGEINANFQPWGKPMNVRDPARGINRSPHGFGGPPGAGGALFAMADGSVRFIRDDVSRDVLRALATPNGGEAIPSGVLQEP